MKNIWGCTDLCTTCSSLTGASGLRLHKPPLANGPRMDVLSRIGEPVVTMVTEDYKTHQQKGNYQFCSSSKEHFGKRHVVADTVLNGDTGYM